MNSDAIDQYTLHQAEAGLGEPLRATNALARLHSDQRKFFITLHDVTFSQAQKQIQDLGFSAIHPAAPAPPPIDTEAVKFRQALNAAMNGRNAVQVARAAGVTIRQLGFYRTRNVMPPAAVADRLKRAIAMPVAASTIVQDRVGRARPGPAPSVLTRVFNRRRKPR